METRIRRLGLLVLTLAVLLAAAPSRADVGFRLPNGARSRANTAKGYMIRLDIRPWGPDGNTPQPDFARLAGLRYGGTLAADTSAPDVSGLHATDYEAALIMIAAKDPEWCRQAGGLPCHPGQPTQEEAHDAQYWSFGNRVIEHARELGLAEAPDPAHREPIVLTGPDSGDKGKALAYVASGCEPRRWQWTAPGGFVRNARTNAVTITFPEDGVYTVTAGGSGGNCKEAVTTVTIGQPVIPQPPVGPTDPDGEPGDPTGPADPTDPTDPTDPNTPPAATCEEAIKALRELKPVLERLLRAIPLDPEPEPVAPPAVVPEPAPGAPSAEPPAPPAGR